MSIVEERRRENWRGVRRGVKVLVEGSWEGKMEMWRGLFWGGELAFRFGCVCFGCLGERDGMGWGRTYVAAYDAEAGDGGNGNGHGDGGLDGVS